MNNIRSERLTSAFMLSVLGLITVLAGAVPSKAQQIPIGKSMTFQEAVTNAKNERWERWKALKATLLDERKMLLDQVRKKYEAKIQSATTVAQAKAYRWELDVEAKKISAAVKEELEKTLAAVNDAFCYNVEEICKQYGEPIPRWLARFR